MSQSPTAPSFINLFHPCRGETTARCGYMSPCLLSHPDSPCTLTLSLTLVFSTGSSIPTAQVETKPLKLPLVRMHSQYLQTLCRTGPVISHPMLWLRKVRGPEVSEMLVSFHWPGLELAKPSFYSIPAFSFSSFTYHKSILLLKGGSCLDFFLNQVKSWYVVYCLLRHMSLSSISQGEVGSISYLNLSMK